MANIAYVRVSTFEQNEERQIKALEEKVNLDEVFIEKISAKDTNRPILQEMCRFVRKGDNVYISDFSRLARSTKDLLELVEQFNEKEVNLISLKENLDTSTPVGRLMLSMIGAINQFERENLLERQREGIAIAKAKGKYRGRKEIEKPDNWEEVIVLWQERKITTEKALAFTGLKRSTFYKFINNENIKRIDVNKDKRIEKLEKELEKLKKLDVRRR